MTVPVGRHDRVLQKTSSILLNSPTIYEASLSTTNIQTKQHASERKKELVEVEDEIISDSEVERTHPYTGNNRKYTIIDPNIIEISSDEEDDAESSLEDSFLARVPGSWPRNDPETNEPQAKPREMGQPWSPRSPATSSKPKRHNRARRIIESSSSDDSEGIVEVTGSPPTVLKHPTPPEASAKLNIIMTDIRKAQVPLAVEFDDIWEDTGAILTLHDPKSARKPIRHTHAPSFTGGQIPPGTGPHKNPSFHIGATHGETTRIASPTSIDTPSRVQPVDGAPTTPKSNTSPRKIRQPPRAGKKANAATEQAKREAYAQNLFTELNHLVFKDGLPKETKLNWNKRLLTTAGRAKWHRSRDGIQTTEIELAEKILDCEERIRNTLSHEMCHLASWIIDDDPKEGHGRLWKAWTTRVMRKRPEIQITTRHDYEISYPYEWECEKCAKIYGRFSKSIRPDECVCGSCKVGKLIPLFLAPSRVPKTPKISRMAAATPQGKSLSSPISDHFQNNLRYAASPCSAPRPSLLSHRDIEKDGCIAPPPRGPIKVYTIHDSDSESNPDIQSLTTAMGSVTITTPEA